MILDGVYIDRVLAARLAPALSTWARSWERVNGGPLIEPVRKFITDLEAMARAERLRNVRNTANDGAAHDDFMSQELLISTAQAAKVLDVTPRAVRARCERGTLPATLTPKGWRIDATAVTKKEK